MHYANGREAKVGDQVIGRCYNTKGLVAGTLVSLTPGMDQCSALVGFLATVQATEVHELHDPTTRWPSFIRPPMAQQQVVAKGTEQHGARGPLAITFYCEEYSHAGALLHVEDAALAGTLPEK